MSLQAIQRLERLAVDGIHLPRNGLRAPRNHRGTWPEVHQLEGGLRQSSHDEATVLQKMVIRPVSQERSVDENKMLLPSHRPAYVVRGFDHSSKRPRCQFPARSPQFLLTSGSGPAMTLCSDRAHVVCWCGSVQPQGSPRRCSETTTPATRFDSGPCSMHSPCGRDGTRTRPGWRVSRKRRRLASGKRTASRPHSRRCSATTPTDP